MNAPLASIIVAVGLVPVAVLYVHTFWSGFGRRPSHAWTGITAITGDLVLSIGYMLFRTFGGEVGGSTFHPQGAAVLFFAFHGLIAAVVIVLEVWFLVSAVGYFRKGTMPKGHARVSKPLFVLWAITFLSGEGLFLFQYFA
jgi:hypothetical protein